MVLCDFRDQEDCLKNNKSLFHIISYKTLLLTPTALIVASRDGKADIVRYLLNQPSTEYNLPNESERTAVMVAKTIEIEDLFLDGYGIIGKNNDLDITGFKKYELIQAAVHGNVEKVNNMLTKKGKCFYGGEQKESKLQHKVKMSLSFGHVKTFQLFIVQALTLMLPTLTETQLLCVLHGKTILKW